MIRLILVLICCSLFFSGCRDGIPTEFVLFDFESDSELDQVHWKCHTLLHLSDKHVTHGAKSLHLELYPSDYPGFSLILEKKDWRDYKTLCFDIYNPGEKEVRLTVRIDDRGGCPDYADRYNHSFIIKPTVNQVRIPLNSLSTSETHRMLDLRSIHKFIIFVVNPAQKVDLYMDYGRLVS